MTRPAGFAGGRKISLWLLSAIFVAAGICHLLKPEPFIQIVPPGIPDPPLVVAISGCAEIICGLGLLVLDTQNLSAWCLIALLAAVFPANIYMAVRHIVPLGMQIPSALLWARLPLQPLLMWWLYYAKKGYDIRRSPS